MTRAKEAVSPALPQRRGGKAGSVHTEEGGASLTLAPPPGRRWDLRGQEPLREGSASAPSATLLRAIGPRARLAGPASRGGVGWVGGRGPFACPPLGGSGTEKGEGEVSSMSPRTREGPAGRRVPPRPSLDPALPLPRLRASAVGGLLGKGGGGGRVEAVG